VTILVCLLLMATATHRPSGPRMISTSAFFSAPIISHHFFEYRRGIFFFSEGCFSTPQK